MQAAEVVAAEREAADFKAKADAWIAAHPNKARELANAVAKAKHRGGGDVDMSNVVI